MRKIAALLTILFSVSACAESDHAAPDTASVFEAGTHYQVIPEAVRTDDPNKIEVRELFAYTCGHCFKFDPLFHEWQVKQAGDVNVVQTPVVWAAQMEPFARAYYTAKALGVLDKSHMGLFNALHLEKRNFKDADDLAAFFSQYGVEPEKFKKTFDSFGIGSQVKQGDAKVRAYKIKGTPELVVDGKYRVGSRDAGGHEGMLKVVDFLVAKIRKERL